ncbi:hypothetical protein [Variovorax gossypii]
MPSYEIIQRVEMTLTHTIDAPDAATANAWATKRSAARCRAITRRWRSVSFGDIDDDYVLAQDSPAVADEGNGETCVS